MADATVHLQRVPVAGESIDVEANQLSLRGKIEPDGAKAPEAELTVPFHRLFRC